MNAPVETVPLRVTTLRFTLEALESVRLPALTGSTLRGAIGNALRQLTCRTGAATCVDCPLFATCGFAQVWLAGAPEKLPGAPLGATDRADQPADEPAGALAETAEAIDQCTDGNTDGSPYPAESDAPAKKQAHASPPYVISPPPWTGRPTYLMPGGLFGFTLHVFGPPILRVQTWESAVRLAALNGFAQGRGRLLTTCHVDGPYYPTLPGGAWRSTLRLDCLTPLHIVRERRRLTHFDPVALTRRLLARIDHLMERYGDAAYPLPADDLIAMAGEVRVLRSDLQPVHDHRVSDLQGRTIPIHGFVGSVTLGAVPRPLRDLWSLGEVLHVGKGTPMGLGRIRLEAIA